MLVALLVCACWYPKDRGQRLEQRLERVEDESPMRQREEDRAATQEQARRVDAMLAEMKKRLDALTAAQKAGDERAAKPDRTGEELSRLVATLEEHAQRLAALEKTLAARPPEPAERVAAPSVSAAPPRRAKREAAGEPPKAEAPVPEDKAGYLAFAREQERKGQPAVARDLYEGYVQKFPADPTAAEAYFRLGELAFAERRYQDAVREYGKVARDFPRSAQAPDALLRTAESMLAMGLKEEGESVLAEVPKRYPASPAAGRARQRLAQPGRK